MNESTTQPTRRHIWPSEGVAPHILIRGKTGVRTICRTFCMELFLGVFPNVKSDLFGAGKPCNSDCI